MTTPTDWREMCTELLDVIDSLPCETNYKGESRCVFPIDEDVVSRARFALNQSEPEGHAMLNWSEERQPCEDCRYNHCVAETPFGKFVISWKGWKEYSPVTVDESPFGDWFECWNSVENAKAACQTEYSRRLAIARFAHPAIEPVPVSERWPEFSDCDHQERVWAWNPVLEHWRLNRLNRSIHTHWLPHHALPLPTNEQ